MAMTPDLVVGLDSSTTATKAIGFDARGLAIAEARASIPLSNPKPGWLEQDVHDWTQSAAIALNQLTQKIDPRRIAGIAISNQRETFAQFDGSNNVLRPATVWLDERAHQEVKDLDADIGGAVIHQISGKPPDITPCLYRCLWLSRHMPKVWAKTAMTSEVHGVLTHFLTGQWHTSLASADPMGLIDIAKGDWSDVLLKAANLRRDQLPKLFRPGAVMGEVSPLAAQLTGLKAGTPVIAGGGDGQCAGAGANFFASGRAYFNLGTGVVSGRFGKSPTIDPAFRSLTAVSEDGYAYETVIRTGTFLINWLVETMFNVDTAKTPDIFQDLEKEAKASPIGARGLVILPYWSGSMTPYWDTAARGVIAGLSGSHTRGDIYRSVMEGVALEQAMMSRKVAAATTDINHFAIVGGGSRSDLWCQIIADATALDVKRLDTAEASALGAGMAAARAVGWFKTIPQAAAAMSGRPSKTFRPRKKQSQTYQELLALYSALWPQISAWNSKMQDFTRSQNK